MDQELKNRLDVMDRKLEAIFVSAEKTRKYFLIAMVVSLIAFVLPLVGLVFAIPSFLSTYGQLLSM
ncbi:MAG: hypothetical protein KBD06_04705 [Candidatus Pacebacteria bacterium]|nr:hypothetical protein [Candidatus Paceibacterota bacterium]